MRRASALLLAVAGVANAAGAAPPTIERIATIDPPAKAVEIVAWHAASRTLLWVDAEAASLGLLAVSSFDPLRFADAHGAADPAAIPLGAAPTSVAADPTRPQALVALLGETRASPGRVVSFDLRPGQLGERRFEVEVGVHPDSIAITADGRLAVVACEGEGDPATPGAIAVIDLAAAEDGTPGAVVLVEGLAEAGLGPIGGIEPEFVAIDSRSRFAAVSLQENDAVAIVDLRASPPTLAAVLRLPPGADPDGVALLDGHPSPRDPSVSGVLLAVAAEGRKTDRGRRGGQIASFHWFDPQDLSAPLPVGRVDLRTLPGMPAVERTDPEGIVLLRLGGAAFAAVGLERRDGVALIAIDAEGGPTLAGLAATGSRPEGLLAIPLGGGDSMLVSGDEGEPGTLTFLRVRGGPSLADAESAAAAAAGLPQASRLRAWHDLVAFEPQVAGTPGDHRSIDRLLAAFASMGLSAEAWWFRPLLAQPLEASLEIVSPEGTRPLPLREDAIASDPDTAHPELDFAWNAFSGSGEVEAEVVYAHRGLAADYERLRAWGVQVEGRIVLVRYGGAYRGHKVRHAEANGAAGVVLFTDPADAGHLRGPVWPEGGWANGSQIERGSVLTLPQPGDALTPFVPAVAEAPRRRLEEAGLFSVPVQPIGYAAAEEILRRMRGREAATLEGGESWQGGIATPHRVEGGPDLRLRMKVRQERRLADTANVLASLEGETHPQELVVVGCHHDAWGFGAGDPHAGTIVMLEVARAFGAMAAEGLRPRRTLLFAAWGAEEFGIIGSSEWVEANRDRLASHGIAYLNLDMAAMGPRFSMNASPSLRAAARRAAAAVPAAGDAEGRSVLALAEADGGAFRPGTPGGGSDHVGFLGHVAMPVATLHGGGSEGASYHSAYDTLAWYRAVVGDDYEPAIMLARIAANLAAQLAFEAVLPLRTEAVAAEAAASLRRIAVPAEMPEVAAGVARLADRLEALAERAAAIDAALDALAAQASGVESTRIDAVNAALRAVDRAWWDERGLAGRPWFRNLAVAPDRESGYGATTMPILAESILDDDADAAAEAIVRLAEAVDRLEAALAALAAALGES